jgi:hypothetical protein
LIGSPPLDSGSFHFNVTVVEVVSLTSKSLGSEGTPGNFKLNLIVCSWITVIYELELMFLIL